MKIDASPGGEGFRVDGSFFFSFVLELVLGHWRIWVIDV